MIIEQDQIEVNIGTYIRSKPNILSDHIATIADDYKKHIAQKLIPLDPEELSTLKNHTSKKKLGEILHVSIKVDGESVIFIYDETEKDSQSYFCNASSHRIWLGLKVNQEFEDILKKKKITQGIFAGELLAIPINNTDFNDRAHISDFLHCSRNPQDQTDLDRIGFKVFDLIELNHELWINRPYSDRFNRLNNILTDDGRVSIVRTQLLKEFQIADFYDKVVNEGKAEGIVIRNSDSFRGYKVKPIHTLDVVIIGVVSGLEGSSIEPDMLSSTLVALRYSDGTYQILASVGGGLSEEKRRDLWKQFEFVTQTSYIAATHDGRAFRMVKPQIVAQIEYLDISTSNINNQLVMQGTLIFNTKENAWEILHPMPFVKLISPRFDSNNPIREDKTGSVEDVRVSQITEFVDLDIEKGIKKTVLPKSEILIRNIYEKGTSVRKIIGWKTNKKVFDSCYPNFVIYTCDYSEGRNTPLERKVKITDDEQQFWVLIDDWIKEEMADKSGSELKRGWTLFSNNDIRQNLIGSKIDNVPSLKKTQKKTTKKTKQK